MRLRGLLLEFSLTRSDYKNQLEHILIGAIKEFYKSECAKANGEKKWVAHWTTEYTGLLSRFGDMLLHSVKGCRNRHKAANEVVAILQNSDKQFRKVANNIVSRDFKRKMIKPIPEEATARFYELVQAEITASLD